MSQSGSSPEVVVNAVDRTVNLMSNPVAAVFVASSVPFASFLVPFPSSLAWRGC